ncbi:hypothetical protein BOO94_29390 [Pseudomonas sp. FSL W5-0299]|nr:hypothetical protein BOO94_29390 [Pseudomonas sp. FSL W5-0299]
MGQQAFVIDIGGDDEHSADLADDGGLEGRRIEVVIQRAAGGFVELFGIERIVGGNVVGFRGIGCGFEHGETP